MKVPILKHLSTTAILVGLMCGMTASMQGPAKSSTIKSMFNYDLPGRGGTQHKHDAVAEFKKRLDAKDPIAEQAAKSHEDLFNAVKAYDEMLSSPAATQKLQEELEQEKRRRKELSKELETLKSKPHLGSSVSPQTVQQTAQIGANLQLVHLLEQLEKSMQELQAQAQTDITKQVEADLKKQIEFVRKEIAKAKQAPAASASAQPHLPGQGVPPASASGHMAPPPSTMGAPPPPGMIPPPPPPVTKAPMEQLRDVLVNQLETASKSELEETSATGDTDYYEFWHYYVLTIENLIEKIECLKLEKSPTPWKSKLNLAVSELERTKTTLNTSADPSVKAAAKHKLLAYIKTAYNEITTSLHNCTKGAYSFNDLGKAFGSKPTDAGSQNVLKPKQAGPEKKELGVDKQLVRGVLDREIPAIAGELKNDHHIVKLLSSSDPNDKEKKFAQKYDAAIKEYFKEKAAKAGGEVLNLKVVKLVQKREAEQKQNARLPQLNTEQLITPYISWEICFDLLGTLINDIQQNGKKLDQQISNAELHITKPEGGSDTARERDKSKWQGVIERANLEKEYLAWSEQYLSDVKNPINQLLKKHGGDFNTIYNEDPKVYKN